MAEREEEQSVIKVNDRRKFNVDGSLREGVALEESKPKAEEKPAAPVAEPVPVVAENETRLTDNQPLPEEEQFDESQIPDAENPAGFANFLLSLASQAAAAMGLAENPMTGRRQTDLEMSRYWIDVLGMLHEKTKGNLHPQEQRLFDGLLSDLRMQYVALTRAAEQQLKKQAAQKFSAKDILGR
jgi:hypothetical protein